MKTRRKLFDLFLWMAVIGFSIWVGGTIFNMSVIVPMWSETPPLSVKAFFGETSFNKYIPNFFGPHWMAIRNLPVVLALLFGWYSKPHRQLLLAAVISIILAVLFTLFYIYPINDLLMMQAGADKSPEEINDLVKKWIFADRLRFAVMLAGYFFLLKAFQLSTKIEKVPAQN